MEEQRRAGWNVTGRVCVLGARGHDARKSRGALHDDALMANAAATQRSGQARLLG